MELTQKIEDLLIRVIEQFAKEQGLAPVVIESKTGAALANKMTVYQPGDDFVGPVLVLQNTGGALRLGFGLVVKKDGSLVALTVGGWFDPTGGERVGIPSSEHSAAPALASEVVKRARDEFNLIAPRVLQEHDWLA